VARTTSGGESEKPRHRRRATSAEEEEREMISLAVGLAKRQLRAGTASPTTINHYLKLAGSQSALEKEKLRHETMLLKARVEALASAQRQEQLYEKALKAFRSYSGAEDSDEDEYYDY